MTNTSLITDGSPVLSILIVSYNTCDYTIDCIQSVLDNEPTIDFEIIVLDNASTDDSSKRLIQKFKQNLILIDSQENLGFAKANNELAMIAKGEYLLLLNPDTVILDEAIEKLLIFARQYTEAKIWGGRTLFGDMTLNPASCWTKQSIWGLICQAAGLSSLFRNTTLFNPEGIGGWNREGVRKVDIVSGCFLLIKKAFWKNLKGFDKDFFMYGEEADLCLRAAEFGADPVVSSQATIVHYGGVSEKIKSDKLVRLLNAKILLISRYFPHYQIRLGVFLLKMWPLTRYLAHSLICLLVWRSSKEKRDVWRNVWIRRREWLAGYRSDKENKSYG